MSGWAVVAIVAIAVWGIVQMARARHGFDKDGVRLEQAPPPQRDAEAQRELADLRERVKILEQITVDGREAKAIADEIERLRSQ